MNKQPSTLLTRQQGVDLSSGDRLQDMAQTQQPSRVFGDAEQLLLDEARARFDFEQKSAVALHSKSALFLTLTGVFAAFVAASIGRLLDRTSISHLEVAALGVFVLSLGLLTLAAILLGRSALSRSYEVIATPGHWLIYLAGLRQVSEDNCDSEAEVLARLRRGILDAWVSAAEGCYAVNEAKASVLDRVSKLLCIAVPIAFVGVLLLLLQAIVR